MYFRRLDPILRQFSPIAPRPRLTPHCGGAPNAGVDGEDPAVAREARTRTVEAGNDASTNVSQSKRKRKAKRRLTVGKDVNKSKRLKMQQQHLEEEYIQQILAGSDHDVYEDDEEIFDSIHVANGKLMKLSPQAQDPAADGPIELAPLSAGLAPIGAGTVPVNKSGSQPTTPVADAKSAATKLAKSEGQKKTQGNKQPNQLRQSLAE
ncbi:hypothetical protein BZA05DRAFT_402766 [Tricharina praecox]|uniref:uncharacterized protein n=1 Tax=Tricharina praecox TaxID=43433 RepID=UPI00221E9A72|nr:uncharacterized protein BZA05DRAFT_402766 [Tricharina praecox]KAI5848807.1 hypothetical protein BZA05DRAFT_402766 [Tricharina praecox]